MADRIPVLICIDVEPDAREVCPRSRADWKGFERTFRLFDAYRPRAERATGAPARFNWFLRMDPQVAAVYGSPAWAAERYDAEFGALCAAGDELGLHPHPWRWDEGRGRWVADFGDQTWVGHCVRLSFATFGAAFGRRCAAFRFGDGWMNAETWRLVAGLGADFDLTLEPGRRHSLAVPRGEHFTGAFPDYARVPREPYRPSEADFRVRGGGRLWAIPISTALVPPWPAAPAYRRAVWRLRYGARRWQPLFLGLEPAFFARLVGDLLRASERPYLCLPLRSDDALRPERERAMRENLDALLRHPAAARLSFDTPAGAVARLTRAEGRAREASAPVAV